MTARLHILVLEGWPTLLAGGQERSLFEVVTGLRRAGVEVTLAYEEEGELVPRYEASGVQTFLIPTRNLQLKTRHVLRNFTRFATAVARIGRRHRRQGRRIDLIYVNQYFDTPLAALCAWLLGVPAVCHLRLPAPEYLSRQYRWGLSRCAKLIANSRFTAETFIAAGLPAARIEVVHNAIDLDEFSPAGAAQCEALARREFRQVLYVGRITPEKGIDTLIEAMAIARQQDPRLRLLIVGNVRGAHTATQQYLAELRAKAETLLGDAVDFRPATPAVLDLYRNADLVVLPSRFEAFGRVLIEAMACDVPCIGTRVGGIPEILSEGMGRLLVAKDDAQALSSTILDVFDWRKAEPKLGPHSRLHIRTHFNLEETIDHLLDVLSDAVDRPVRAKRA